MVLTAAAAQLGTVGGQLFAKNLVSSHLDLGTARHIEPTSMANLHALSSAVCETARVFSLLGDLTTKKNQSNC